MTALTTEDRQDLAATRSRCDCTALYCALRVEHDRVIEAIVRRHVTEALTKAARAIDAEVDALDHAGHTSSAAGCCRAALIVRAQLPQLPVDPPLRS